MPPFYFHVQALSRLCAASISSSWHAVIVARWLSALPQPAPWTAVSISKRSLGGLVEGFGPPTRRVGGSQAPRQGCAGGPPPGGRLRRLEAASRNRFTCGGCVWLNLCYEVVAAA